MISAIEALSSGAASAPAQTVPAGGFAQALAAAETRQTLPAPGSNSPAASAEASPQTAGVLLAATAGNLYYVRRIPSAPRSLPPGLPQQGYATAPLSRPSSAHVMGQQAVRAQGVLRLSVPQPGGHAGFSGLPQ